jgi:hypothetical protein
VAAVAKGTSTGRNVRSLTNSATCDFQNIAVAYQFPNAEAGSTGALTRSSDSLAGMAGRRRHPVSDAMTKMGTEASNGDAAGVDGPVDGAMVDEPVAEPGVRAWR